MNCEIWRANHFENPIPFEKTLAYRKRNAYLCVEILLRENASLMKIHRESNKNSSLFINGWLHVQTAHASVPSRNEPTSLVAQVTRRVVCPKNQ
jgi:hypothetical protein